MRAARAVLASLPIVRRYSDLRGEPYVASRGALDSVRFGARAHTVCAAWSCPEASGSRSWGVRLGGVSSLGGPVRVYKVGREGRDSGGNGLGGRRSLGG